MARPISAGHVAAWAQRLREALGGNALTVCAAVGDIAAEMERRAGAAVEDADDLARELLTSVPPEKVRGLAVDIRANRKSWADAVDLVVVEAIDGEQVTGDVRAALRTMAQECLHGWLRQMRAAARAEG